MSIMVTAAYEEEIGGQARRLLLRNDEIERFEVQHQIGIFEIWDQLFGRGRQPRAGHVRDLVALALVGGGMTDRAADDLIRSLPPSQNLHLLAVAKRVLGVTFVPTILDADKKKAGGSPRRQRKVAEGMTLQGGSATSAV